ncbi:AGAP000208-PA, partial [Anopheles gambiae str. PEST]
VFARTVARPVFPRSPSRTRAERTGFDWRQIFVNQFVRDGRNKAAAAFGFFFLIISGLLQHCKIKGEICGIYKKTQKIKRAFPLRKEHPVPFAQTSGHQHIVRPFLLLKKSAEQKPFSMKRMSSAC